MDNKSEIKLEKINERLYNEIYKDGKSFKWKKRLRFISLTLTDFRTELFLDIDRPEFTLRSEEEDPNPTVEEDSTADRATTFPSPQNEDRKYSQDFNWRIVGRGYLNGNRVGLIQEGRIGLARAEEFESTDVILRSIPDSEKEQAPGYFFYDDAQFDVTPEPNVCLELYVPKTELEKLCEELVSGRLSGLKLGAHVDAFESEIDSALRSPEMSQTVYIEEHTMNKAYLSWITGSKSFSSVVPSQSPSGPVC